MDSRVKRQNPAHLQQNKTEKPHHALCLNIATPKSKVARHAACHAPVRLLSGACRVAIFAFGQRCNPAYHGDIMMSTNRVKEFRLTRAWSQEQLAEMAALSVRTIQRIENQEQPSLETLSALAAVFEVSVSELSGSTQSEGDEALDQRITEARKQLEQESRFYRSVLTAVVVCVLLYILNRTTSPESVWSLWVAAIWGALLVVRGLRVFVFGNLIAGWQKKRLQKLLRK